MKVGIIMFKTKQSISYVTKIISVLSYIGAFLLGIVVIVSPFGIVLYDKNFGNEAVSIFAKIGLIVIMLIQTILTTRLFGKITDILRIPDSEPPYTKNDIHQLYQTQLWMILIGIVVLILMPILGSKVSITIDTLVFQFGMLAVTKLIEENLPDQANQGEE